MIKLIGVIARGGIPVRVRALVDLKSEEFLAGMLEAVKALSSMIGGGEVRMLDFGKNKLLMTESRKGYTVIALVDKAEAYVERLVKIIADDIDNSGIEESTGIVHDGLVRQIDEIIDTYIQSELRESLREIVDEDWMRLKLSLIHI